MKTFERILLYALVFIMCLDGCVQDDLTERIDALEKAASARTD